MSQRHEPSSLFILRMTGFPVEALRALQCPALAAEVDADLERSRGAPVSPKPEFRARYDAEVERTRKSLYEFVSTDAFHQVLLLSTPDLEKLTPTDGVPFKRNSDIRRRELTWLLYLQRLATKNDTVSFFGPSAWGRVDPGCPAPVDIRLAEATAESSVDFEKWVCDAIAEHISAEPEAASLLPLELADDVELKDGEAVRLEAGQAVPLTAEERALVARCDGRSSAGALGAPRELVDSLIERKVLERRLHVPHVSRPMEFLRGTLAAWPKAPLAQRWLAHLDRLDQQRAAFASASTAPARRVALQGIGEALQACGVAESKKSQALYAARLPVVEDCRRGLKSAVIGAPVIERVREDLAPWFELWRDLAGLYATRVHGRLAQVFGTLGRTEVPLPSFYAACARAGIAMAEGGVGLVPTLDKELQQAWDEQLGDRARQRVVDLTADDLGFVRRRFKFQRLRAFDIPAPDLQLAASPEQLARGEWELLLGEIHPDYALWENVFYQWCPDRAAMARDYDSPPRGPAIKVSRSAASGVHTMIVAYDQVPGWTFVGPTRSGGARRVRTADAVAVLTDQDIAVRTRTGEHLGSLLDSWEVANNTHGFSLFGTGAHSPRLRVGRVVVQRESWLTSIDEGLRSAAEEVGPELTIALRGLRARLGLPEEVFVKPQLPLKMTTHKDAKPTFIDFRSPLLHEVLRNLVRRFVELRFSEMFPDSSQCWLRDEAGKTYTCELRLTTTRARSG